MQKKYYSELDAFLRDYPRMSYVPSHSSGLILQGFFDFTWEPKNRPKITDSYKLRILVPSTFPKDIPIVKELDNKILKDDEHHAYHDDSLCLGSPLRLLWNLSINPSLVGFAENCLLQYLYSISHKRKYGTFPFDELMHGTKGIIYDYIDLFALTSAEQVKQSLELISMKKRIANKKPCPCGCRKRLGVCSLHWKINKFRTMAPRSWFKRHLLNPGESSINRQYSSLTKYRSSQS